MQNVVDLDFAAREDVFTYSGKCKNSPNFLEDVKLEKAGLLHRIHVMLLFDFAAAFPSVAHKWMFAVLGKIKIPRGLLKALWKMYGDNNAYIEGDQEREWIF